MLCHRTGRRGVAWLVCLPLLVACISRVSPTPVALSPRPPSASASSGPGSETPSTSLHPAASEGEDPATIFSRVSPSVVFVGTPIGTGSGVVLDPRHVITNAHVVRPYAEARLVDATGDELGTAKVVGFDLLADLAVLASDAPLDAPAMRIGDPADLAVGDRVFLVGFPDVDPDAPEPTMTEGIITSAPLEWHDGLTFHDSDAEIGSGQSGGALVDAAGRLIGISGASRGDLSVSLDVADVLDRAGRIVRGEDVDGLPDRLLPSPANGSLEVRARVASRADAHAWVVDGHQGGPAATVALTAEGGDVGLYALAAGGELANSSGRPDARCRSSSISSRPAHISSRSSRGSPSPSRWRSRPRSG